MLDPRTATQARPFEDDDRGERRRRSVQASDANPVKTLLIINNALFMFHRDNSSVIRTAIHRSDAAVSTLGQTPGTALRMYEPTGSDS